MGKICTESRPKLTVNLLELCFRFRRRAEPPNLPLVELDDLDAAVNRAGSQGISPPPPRNVNNLPSGGQSPRSLCIHAHIHGWWSMVDDFKLWVAGVKIDLFRCQVCELRDESGSQGSRLTVSGVRFGS